MTGKKWTQDDFFGEIRKLSGMPDNAIARADGQGQKPVAGIVIDRAEAMAAEHAFLAAGLPFEMLDHGDHQVRFLVMNRKQATEALKSAKVRIHEDADLYAQELESRADELLAEAELLVGAVKTRDSAKINEAVKSVEHHLEDLKKSL